MAKSLLLNNYNSKEDPVIFDYGKFTSLSPRIIDTYEIRKNARLLQDLEYFSNRSVKNHIYYHLRTYSEEKKKLMKTYKSDPDAMAYRVRGSFMHHLDEIADRLLEYSNFKRIETNTPKYLLDGLYTYGRLRYIYFRSINESDTGYHRHIWDILTILAGKDDECVRKFISMFPGPYTDGYIVIKVIANTLYNILQNEVKDIDKIVFSIDKVQQLKTVISYYKNFALTLKGILINDVDMYRDNAMNTLKSRHRFKDNHWEHVVFHHGIPLYAHALHNLARATFKKRNLPIPLPPDHEDWDKDYNKYIDDPSHKPEFLFDFSQISPTLDEWMRILPSKIDILSL